MDKMRQIAIALAATLVATGAHAADRGYFNCFRSTMSDSEKAALAAWFDDPNIKDCCSLADGMQGFIEDRADGVYTAPRNVTERLAAFCRDNPDSPPPEPPKDRSNWVQVHPQRILHTRNPIGVVIVWWEGPRPRCVVDLDRS